MGLFSILKERLRNGKKKKNEKKGGRKKVLELIEEIRKEYRKY